MSQNFINDNYIPGTYLFNELPEYQPISRLSDSMAESMRMMADIQNLKDSLPGIDCGACGAPSCRAFAEDVVRGLTTVDDCLILRTPAPSGKEKDNDSK